MKIYIVNGAPRAGKTTFEGIAEILIGKDHCAHISTIDFVKEIATECGWDGTKTDKNRRFLSDLKDLLIRWDNIPFKKIEEKVKELELVLKEPSAVFIDCREPNEIDKLHRALNAKTIIIRNLSAEKVFPSNHADANILNYNYDYIIENNSTYMYLIEKVQDFLIEEGFMKE